MKFGMLVLINALLFTGPLTLSSNAEAHVPKIYDWTIVAYQNGYNPLTDEAVRGNIKKLETIGSSNSIAIVADWGSFKDGKTRRMLIEKNGDMTAIHSPILEESSADMGNQQTFEDFLLWATKNYPSRRLMLIIGADGAGWKGVSWDKRFGTIISIPKLRQALEKLKRARGLKTDLIIFDACVMGAVEVAYEIRNTAEIMVAGIDKLPDDRWIPYDLAIGQFEKNTADTNINIGKLIAKSYYDSLIGFQHSGDEIHPTITGIQFGVIRLAKIEPVKTAAGELSQALLRLSDMEFRQTLDFAKKNTQKLYSDRFIDFGEWSSHLKSNTSVEAAAVKVMGRIKEAVKFSFNSVFYPNALGLTVGQISSADKEVPSTYLELSWADDTHWAALMKRMLDLRGATQNE